MEAPGERIGLAVEEGGVVVWQKAFDAAELDDLIKLLGRCRAGLPEAVTAELDPNARVETTLRPSIALRDQGEEGVEIMLRHPGYGWLSFSLSQEGRMGLGRSLIEGQEPDTST